MSDTSIDKLQIEKLQQEITQLQIGIERKQQKLKTLRQDVQLKITDHAAIRYMQRVKAFDMKKMQDEIITAQLTRLYTTLGDGTYPVRDDGLCVVIKNGIIITIIVNE